ncbi:hypothetical protein RRF57_008042 [Xylaria bambusicola]|uniref:Uncharacterized protein n=1 Tax=Xylaria bambusicola TaxID=326684 RepID=A0AAN7V198_9PEZI
MKQLLLFACWIDRKIHGDADGGKAGKTRWHRKDIVHIQIQWGLVTDVLEEWRRGRSSWTDEEVDLCWT